MTEHPSLRTCAESIWRAGLRSVAPGTLVARCVRRDGGRLRIGGRTLDLDDFERIFLVAMGKAAPPMALKMSALLGRRLTRGLVCVPPETSFHHPRLEALPVPHPLPDGRSVRAARSILALARAAGPRDLVFVLISGGASAQVSLPVEGLTIGEKRLMTDRLLRSGADIRELNTVRKHLSAFKGGRLAAAAYPAQVWNLVLSDVRHDDLETIASGPTHGDGTTFADAHAVLVERGLWRAAPRGVKRAIERGMRGDLPETLRRSDRVFGRVRTIVIGDVRTALAAAEARARALGFEARTLASWDEGEAREAASRYVARLRSFAARHADLRRPVCFLAGGELSVTVRGRGKGGRNMEFVLAALVEMMAGAAPRPPAGERRKWSWLIASLGTDGRDGPTDAAGAWADAGIEARAARLGFDPAAYLERNDSYSFFKKAGGLIRTGPTGTNVMDLRLFLLKLGIGAGPGYLNGGQQAARPPATFKPDANAHGPRRIDNKKNHRTRPHPKKSCGARSIWL